jgi:hypothetical protein
MASEKFRELPGEHAISLRTKVNDIEGEVAKLLWELCCDISIRGLEPSCGHLCRYPVELAIDFTQFSPA